MEFAQEQNRDPDRRCRRRSSRDAASPKQVGRSTPAACPDELKQRRSFADLERQRRGVPRAGEGRAAGRAATTTRRELVEKYGDEYDEKAIGRRSTRFMKKTVRESILNDDRRPDGREPTEIRPIRCEVGVLPRVHGTGLFTRGQTQVLSVTTLGGVGDAQRLDTLSPDRAASATCTTTTSRRTRVGEAGRMGGAGPPRDRPRRAGRARAVAGAPERRGVPVHDPRGLRGALEQRQHVDGQRLREHLSLMDAGVPIKAPVAGVAMGLIMGEDGNYQVLTDIAGLEDAMGDMDFKVAGHREGHHRAADGHQDQGDPDGDPAAGAVEQAREGRMFIMGKMLEAISEPREEMSPFAPRMYRMQIDPDEDRHGDRARRASVIRSIIEETGCSVDIEDDGTVFIGATNEEQAQRAIGDHRGDDEGRGGRRDLHRHGHAAHELRRVRGDPARQGRSRARQRAGRLPRAVGPRKSSRWATRSQVMVIEVDSMGRMNLSRRAVLAGETDEAVVVARSGERGSLARHGGAGGGDRGGDRGARRRRWRLRPRPRWPRRRPWRRRWWRVRRRARPAAVRWQRRPRAQRGRRPAGPAPESRRWPSRAAEASVRRRIAVRC